LKSAGENLNSSASHELLQDRLATLRRQTLQHIDNVLASPHTTVSPMVKAACAYCLVSSASSAEAMKYAQRLRLEKLRQVLASDVLTEHFATGVLQYLLSTTSTFKRVFSRPLSDALSNIQRRPLLVDLDLAASDIIGSNDMLALIPEDIKTFSPYFKRDPITASALSSILEQWMVQACESLAKALDRQLEDITSITSIIALRGRLYSTLLPSYFSAPASKTIFGTTHRKVGERIAEVISLDISKLEDISKELSGSATTEIASLDLWDTRVVKMGLGNGAASFLDQVHKRRHGLSSRTSALSRALQLWISRVLQHLATFEECRQVRWRDLLEQPDEEQEEEASAVVTSLTETDPLEFLSQANTALQSAINAFETEMIQAVSKSTQEASEVAAAVHCLRAVRVALKPLQQAFPEQAALVGLTEALPALHKFVADKVADRVLSELDADHHNISKLDNMPSPAAFGFLQNLCLEMSATGGTDIWSAAAVRCLKEVLQRRIFEVSLRDRLIRTEFDLAYLRVALDAEVDGSDQEAAQASAAQDYWKRTRLLFGALHVD
jgi:conserved oligomeric Golgi complex subunit 1